MRTKAVNWIVLALTVGMMINVFFVANYFVAMGRAEASMSELRRQQVLGRDVVALYMEQHPYNMTTLEWFYDESEARMYFHLDGFIVFGIGVAGVVTLGLPGRDKHGRGDAKVPGQGSGANPDDHRAP